MAQASPTNILLAQAVVRLEYLRRSYSLSKFRTTDEIGALIGKALTNFEESAGKSLTQYNPIYRSEVPNSGKMNAFWSNLQDDLNIIQEQMDLLKAAAVNTHNYIKVEIQKATQDNLRSQNRLKTLELYSNVNDASLVYFGDTFITEDFIDWEAISVGETRLRIVGNQAIGLGINTQESALDDNPSITILTGSNGFLGNNQEIEDPQQAASNSVSSDRRYYFKSETYPASKTEELVDGEPTSWIEFEKYYIPPAERASALNYNFNYRFTNNPRWEYLRPLMRDNNTVNWADGIGETVTQSGGDGTLKFNIELDLKAPQRSNIVTLLPFGLPDNANNPIKVVRVATSLDKTVWTTLNPQNVWIANGIDRKIIDIDSDNIVIGEGTWATNGDPIRFVRFEIEQPRPIQCNIGHLYYLMPEDTETSADVVTTGRQLGPVPTLDEPNQYLDVSSSEIGDLIQRTEYFIGKRWAIGIRDINILNNTYHESGSFVSRRFDIPGIIDRVAIEAEIDVPDDYAADENWIRFYVSPNDGAEWFQISRIQDDYLGIPEIIAFNDPTPQELREPGIAYYDVLGTVNSLRVKVTMERPSDKEFSTPLLKPYRLKIKKRV